MPVILGHHTLQMANLTPPQSANSGPAIDPFMCVCIMRVVFSFYWQCPCMTKINRPTRITQ